MAPWRHRQAMNGRGGIVADDLSRSPRGDRRADEDAIRELLARQVMGWDAGDPDGVLRDEGDY
jgi:hypothetical protein